MFYNYDDMLNSIKYILKKYVPNIENEHFSVSEMNCYYRYTLNNKKFTAFTLKIERNPNVSFLDEFKKSFNNMSGLPHGFQLHDVILENDNDTQNNNLFIFNVSFVRIPINKFIQFFNNKIYTKMISYASISTNWEQEIETNIKFLFSQCIKELKKILQNFSSGNYTSNGLYDVNIDAQNNFAEKNASLLYIEMINEWNTIIYNEIGINVNQIHNIIDNNVVNYYTTIMNNEYFVFACSKYDLFPKINIEIYKNNQFHYDVEKKLYYLNIHRQIQ